MPTRIGPTRLSADLGEGKRVPGLEGLPITVPSGVDSGLAEPLPHLTVTGHRRSLIEPDEQLLLGDVAQDEVLQARDVGLEHVPVRPERGVLHDAEAVTPRDVLETQRGG